MANEPIVRIVDNPAAPEIFASAATGFFVANGNVTITFESARADHAESPGPVYRAVVGRVVIPAQGAQALAIGLFDFLEKQGFDFKRNQTS
jgi:hypothetical protein